MKNKVSTMRKNIGFSQMQLAKACGVSQQQISKIETSKQDPSLPLAFLLSHILGCPLDELFKEEGER